MNSLLTETMYWGGLISIGSYVLGQYLHRKTKLIIFNPLLFSTALIIIVLLLFDIDYDAFYEKTSYLNYLLTPAAICLAVPLYEQIQLLKDNIKAIMVGILSGVISSLMIIACSSVFFHFSHEIYVTILPKSITGAMAMGISEELKGIPSLTIPVVIMTGITGNIVASSVCRFFKITNSIARGVAIGSASHAMGTAKALEMGEIEGAMSSLSIAVAGIMTVILAPIFANIV